MKKILSFAASAVLLAACTDQQPSAKISGNIQGIKSDTLLIIYNSETGSESMTLDTIVLDNGKFAYDLPVEDEMGLFMIVESNNFIESVSFANIPGDHIVLNGTMTDLEISGSQFYNDLNEYNHLIADQTKRDKALLHSIPEEGEELSNWDGAGFEKARRQIKTEIDSLSIEFIKAHPDADLSVYLAYDLIKPEYFAMAEGVLTERAKTGIMSDKLEAKRASLQANEVRNEARKVIYEGAEAPDFSLPTSTGETFTLSAQRGQWVMLDFWGTWCGWCVEGLPHVKEIAHTYTEQLKVVSVDCGDSEKAWRKGIEKHGMDWTQVYNSREDAIDSKFAVEGYPGFYLINPEGIIVKMWFGEPANFVQLVGELIQQ